MTIPNVVLGELIDPVTFGNAVVDAVNEHETEIEDRLPLSGGTITGDLEVGGQIKTTGGGSQEAPAFQLGPDKALGMFGHIGSQYIRIVADGEYRLQVGTLKTTVYQDLQVEGVVLLPNARNESSSNAPNLYLTSTGSVKHTTFQAAPKAFAIAPDIDTADALERAATAIMPTDEGITVNEVVTALLVKVRQLEERIEALEA